jgi:hypothetical protein
VNGYGALVERYGQGKTEVVGEKHYTALVEREWLGIEQWWNVTDRGKHKCWDRNLSPCKFIHHKSHMDSPWVELGHRGERPTNNHQRHGGTHSDHCVVNGIVSVFVVTPYDTVCVTRDSRTVPSLEQQHGV